MFQFCFFYRRDIEFYEFSLENSYTSRSSKKFFHRKGIFMGCESMKSKKNHVFVEKHATGQINFCQYW